MRGCRLRKTLYGWRATDGRYCLSRVAPDYPQTPQFLFGSIGEAERQAESERARVIWSGSAALEKEQGELRRAADDGGAHVDFESARREFMAG